MMMMMMIHAGVVDRQIDEDDVIVSLPTDDRS
jgi:hypothetical protein